MDVRRALEDSLRRIDALIEAKSVKRDRVKTEFGRNLELIRFGLVEWSQTSQ